MYLKKHFYWINLVFLGSLSIMLWLRDTSIPWVDSSGAYLVSVYFLSMVLFHVQYHRSQNIKLALSLIWFIPCFYLLQGLSLIVLQRFSRARETYALADFGDFLIANSHLWIDSIICWGFYTLIFHVVSSRIQLASLEEINRYNQQEINQIHKSKLRNELNPHFLFNAMNSIAMKVRLNESQSAVEMIAALNDLLRASLRTSTIELIPLHQELELLDKYLIIERERFDNDPIQFEIAEDTRELLIPELLLQPVLENAFKHTRELDQENTQVKVSSRLIDSRLIITIFNTSEMVKLILQSQNSIGLPNVISRLRRQYGLDFQFQSILEEDGIAFKINIPAK